MMIKQILLFLGAITLFFAFSYFPHQYFLSLQETTLRFSLFSIYVFHYIATILVYILVSIIAEKMPNQAGYAYLASVFLKLGVFLMIFQSSIFSDEILSKIEKTALIIPLFLFLLIEAVFVSKVLNTK